MRLPGLPADALDPPPARSHLPVPARRHWRGVGGDHAVERAELIAPLPSLAPSRRRLPAASVLQPCLWGNLVETPRLTPSDYLRLRRVAAGLSVADAARRLIESPADQRRAEEFLRRLETPGRTALYRSTIAHLLQAFPFDPDAYWQLAEEPRHRHPRICHGCGCSAHDRCSDAEGGACHWVEQDRCSACSQGARRCA